MRVAAYIGTVCLLAAMGCSDGGKGEGDSLSSVFPPVAATTAPVVTAPVVTDSVMSTATSREVETNNTKGTANEISINFLKSVDMRGNLSNFSDADYFKINSSSGAFSVYIKPIRTQNITLNSSISAMIVTQNGTVVTFGELTDYDTPTSPNPGLSLFVTPENVETYFLILDRGGFQQDYSILASSYIEFKKGVIFRHATHALNSCTSCHPSGSTPGKITGFGKDFAHKTCKDCHTEMGKGPTNCKGCHIK